MSLGVYEERLLGYQCFISLNTATPLIGINMKHLLLLTAIVGLCSCKLLCDGLLPVASAFSDIVSVECKCANPDEVRKDILTWVNDKLVCDTTPEGKTGLIASIACPVAGFIVTRMISKKFPETWGCTDAKGCVGKVVALGVSACELLPVRSN